MRVKILIVSYPLNLRRSQKFMKYKIEKANIDDSDKILKIQKLAYKEEADRYNVYDIPPLTQTVDEIKEQFKNHLILKAAFENKIIGTVRAYKKNKTCYIGRLAVHPDMQNKGIGTALMKAIESCFTPMRYELFTGEKSKKDIHIYEKLGYKIFKTDTENCGTIKLVYMEKIKTL